MITAHIKHGEINLLVISWVSTADSPFPGATVLRTPGTVKPRCEVKTLWEKIGLGKGDQILKTKKRDAFTNDV
jgi:hypothetical protein